MKLIAYTLLDIDEYLAERNVLRALTLFERCNRILQLMIAQLDQLETMSPKEYQQIRLQLGNGSGQESPGFRALLKILPNIWRTFESTYLIASNRSIENIYDSNYAHDERLRDSRAMLSFDELLQKFRVHHIFLIHRSIGMGAASLKGRPVELLKTGVQAALLPLAVGYPLAMTDAWGGSYGRVRQSIGPAST